MREASKDLRVIRTKALIREALIDLIDEKGFDAITVRDITTRARINRGTFYSHYQDKFDLMTQCQEEYMDKMKEIFKQNITEADNNHSNIPPTLPFNVMVTLFEYLDQNRMFMRAVSGPKGDMSFQTRMKEFLWKTLFVRKEFPLVKQENLLVPSEYLIAYLVSAHIGVIEQWLNGEGKESPAELAHILATITVKGPFTAAGLNS
ncbi:TetR family transcriptional regulator [Paenibacillus sp. VTT E-133280]|jgi:AcrR family transcriptional regulator|uniref:TetR/AcrR family transcriptional regulator n=1 Tax=unclassified Paenibacillus TaxID=185978 RepID=UPI000BA14CAB|nr:TetR/AcrR family transcriptional regulator [Paenibacillus sp. VTT E-133280]OZQ67261.1 TetR family transcriptional regulator [Paenibacillus sp. VTT E-133280]